MTIKYVVVLLVALLSLEVKAGETKKEVYAVLNVDVSGTNNVDRKQLGNILRMHLEKTDSFQVIDKYDMAYLLADEADKFEYCYGKLCLTELGKKIKADKVVSGTVDVMGDMIIVTLRRVDVASGEIDKTLVKEYLNLTVELGYMLQISLNELLGLPNPEALVVSLTKKDAFANTHNTPFSPRLAVDGPRFGMSGIAGKSAKILLREENQGGFNAYPMSFHFGYQFEKQYLNEGNFQALFEFIPMLTGLEQGRVSASFTLMNGIRSNRNGWEFAFGPTISTVKIANVAQDATGNWLTESMWKELHPGLMPENGFRKQLDSRGEIKLDAGFVLGIGKTFRSGNLNIPVNLFVVPKKDDFKFGISVGYNSSR
ncbi:MAG: hypothetical protein EP332_10720 [Bacteroidetes bacterium]|nr:MAG: hypothetical protein EP332_10720 [Bacteroidota bacterium]